jgi:hypothetical protein
LELHSESRKEQSLVPDLRLKMVRHWGQHSDWEQNMVLGVALGPAVGVNSESRMGCKMEKY